MILDSEEINNKLKISFYERHRTPILWIVSVLIIVLVGLFCYGLINFETAILPFKILVISVFVGDIVFVITLLVIFIHELLDSKF